MADSDFDRFVEQYHRALIEFAKGNAKPVNALLSHRGDVSLAGGFGGVTRGFEQVVKNIEVAATQFKTEISFESLTKYAVQDVGYILEIERYQGKLFGREDLGQSVIRCTSIFRREDGVWKLVHRHGDPIPAVLALARALPYSVVSIQKAL